MKIWTYYSATFFWFPFTSGLKQVPSQSFFPALCLSVLSHKPQSWPLNHRPCFFLFFYNSMYLHMILSPSRNPFSCLLCLENSYLHDPIQMGTLGLKTSLKLPQAISYSVTWFYTIYPVLTPATLYFRGKKILFINSFVAVTFRSLMQCTSFSTFCWLEHSHMTSPESNGGWEMCFVSAQEEKGSVNTEWSLPHSEILL